MGEFVRLEVDDRVGTIRIDRPKLNAIDRAVARGLAETAREAAERDDVGAVVIWGGPKIFAAGADVNQMVDLTPAEVAPVIAELQDALDLIEAIPKVTIAAINGYALGGGYELALCADFRFGGENAKVGQPEIQLGIIPGAGGTQRLPRLVGTSVARELIYSGRQVKSAEAVQLGLLDKVFASDDVYAQAVEAARDFSRGPLVALGAAKHAINRGLDGDLASGLRLERQVFIDLFGTVDQKSGMRSLLERGPGKAEFQGR